MDAGLQRFGSGAFASVYGHPDLDFVVKVGGYSNEHHRPDAWPEYAKMVMAQFQNNPHAPKITALREFPQGFYYSIMEPLERTVGHDHPFFWKLMNVLESWGSFGTVEFEIQHPELYDLLRGIKSLEKAIDLHSDNAMLRKDGSMVITDPIY